MKGIAIKIPVDKLIDQGWENAQKLGLPDSPSSPVLEDLLEDLLNYIYPWVTQAAKAYAYDKDIDAWDRTIEMFVDRCQKVEAALFWIAHDLMKAYGREAPRDYIDLTHPKKPKPKAN